MKIHYRIKVISGGNAETHTQETDWRFDMPILIFWKVGKKFRCILNYAYI
jgi:hypothetical protein